MKKVGTIILYRIQHEALQRDTKAKAYFQRNTLVVDTVSTDPPNSILCCRNDVTTVTGSWLFLEIRGQRLETFRSSCCVLEDVVKIKVYNCDRVCGETQFVMARRNTEPAIFNYLYFLSGICNTHHMYTVIIKTYLLSIVYLADNPMGIKQNRLLKTYFAEFFICVSRLQMMAAMSSYAWLIPPRYHILCLRVFNTLVSQLYRHTVRVLVDCISIFGGRNYNSLKNRTDKVEYSPDVIILASIVFAFAALVVYNILGFYMLAAVSQAVEAALEILISTFVLVFSTDALLCTGDTIKVRVTKTGNYTEYDVVHRHQRKHTTVVACMQAVLEERGITKTKPILKGLLLGDIFSGTFK